MHVRERLTQTEKQNRWMCACMPEGHLEHGSLGEMTTTARRRQLHDCIAEIQSTDVFNHYRNSLRLTENRRRQRGIDAAELFLRVAGKILQSDGQVSPNFLTWWESNGCHETYQNIEDVSSSFDIVQFKMSVFVDVRQFIECTMMMMIPPMTDRN